MRKPLSSFPFSDQCLVLLSGSNPRKTRSQRSLWMKVLVGWPPRAKKDPDKTMVRREEWVRCGKRKVPSAGRFPRKLRAHRLEFKEKETKIGIGLSFCNKRSQRTGLDCPTRLIKIRDLAQYQAFLLISRTPRQWRVSDKAERSLGQQGYSLVLSSCTGHALWLRTGGEVSK